MPVNATFGSIVHSGIYWEIPVENTAGKCHQPTLSLTYFSNLLDIPSTSELILGFRLSIILLTLST